MGYDDCGHAYAYDVSTPEKEAAILEGICKEVAKAGRFNPAEKAAVKQALANKDFNTVYEILDDDILHVGQRGSPSIVEVQETWKTGNGALNL
jgi:hypothetical protein